MQRGPLKLKMQLVCGSLFAMGPGKAELLEAIAREGSISAAGRAMGMSYRKAWVLVDEMNHCFTAALVETISGGGKQRGARLTETGARALAAFRAIEAEAAEVAKGPDYAELVALLRDEPG